MTNPEAGEADAGTTPVPAEEVSAAFQLNFMGDNNVVTTAGRDVSQQVSLDGPRWHELRETLADLGVPGDELGALKDALEDDVNRDLPAGALGPSTATWLERINEAIKTGAVAVGTDAAGGLIAIELLKFLGQGRHPRRLCVGPKAGCRMPYRLPATRRALRSLRQQRALSPSSVLNEIA